jgi:hypothetical protein
MAEWSNAPNEIGKLNGLTTLHSESNLECLFISTDSSNLSKPTKDCPLCVVLY